MTEFLTISAFITTVITDAAFIVLAWWGYKRFGLKSFLWVGVFLLCFFFWIWIPLVWRPIIDVGMIKKDGPFRWSNQALLANFDLLGRSLGGIAKTVLILLLASDFCVLLRESNRKSDGKTIDWLIKLQKSNVILGILMVISLSIPPLLVLMLYAYYFW